MLDGISKTDLTIIKTESGSIFHAIKNTDAGFREFGEVYFSTVIKDAVKAWKLHQKMTLNLIVPVGSVLFCFVDMRSNSNTYNETYKIVLSQEAYCRLTVPPGIWFGFKGISDGLNMICNVADIPHDPNEVMRKDVDEINMDWSIK
jgi:dTDP-4-dehydrorhamnose 3,5-epimerase